MNDLKNKRLFLLDMDGTLYIDDHVFPDVHEFLRYIKESGRCYMFLTNISSKGTDKYVEKLARLGIPATEDEFFTSADAMAIYLKEKATKKIRCRNRVIKASP